MKSETGCVSVVKSILQKSNQRIASIALVIFGLDQFTKWLVLRYLPIDDEKVLIRGFFKLVNWGNTGAAWSLFRGNNSILAAIGFIALLVIAIVFLTRHHDWVGQIAFGLIAGGIAGNLVDRVRIGHVTDFIYFYLQQRGGGEVGFPAFNIADSAICTGVALIFLITWKNEHSPKRSTEMP